ncbi:lovastatin nonaketide synthase [Xylaria arbuscula]|nr:lovastatin nonaketide synthase [Xylaria arbuscula]
MSLENETVQPLAVVGLSFEFSQDATSVEDFWQIIHDGRSTGTEFPPDRMNIGNFYHPDNRPSSVSVKNGHFTNEKLAAFDAPFFSITPLEASCMDPQHRRMLEIAYHALEDAGIPMENCSGSNTSVYTGCFTNDYLSIMQQDYEAEQSHAAMGIAPSMLANRISWFFNFKGTSMNIDSACSSSLAALHLACQDLRSGASSMALVGGANFVYHPNFMKLMTDFNFLSKDGRSWSFDQRANGYARGDGTAVIVIKRLEEALKDGHTIRALIRHTASNQDGKTPGITQPSQAAQVDLIKRAYREAGLSMEPARFVEAHGTGTPVGDPIEANALGQAFGKYRSTSDPLYVGAVKSNIGHLEGCSGLAGVIKTILVLERGIIPPIAGLQSLNKKIDANALKLAFPKEPKTWPPSIIRRATVNSFGFGGTNAMAIIDDAKHFLELHGLLGNHYTQPDQTQAKNEYSSDPSLLYPLQSVETLHHDSVVSDAEHMEAYRLLVWSGADQTSVRCLSEAYVRYIEKNRQDLANTAYTLSARRSHLSWRSFVVASPNDEVASSDKVPIDPVLATGNPQVAFIFTGQGAQYLGMGRELLSFAAFSESLEKLQLCLNHCGCQWSLRDFIGGRNEVLDIDSPRISQPATTCLQIAIVDYLRILGLSPSVVIGHSSGEIAAAYASGGLSRLAAIKVAYYRGALSSTLAMLSIDLGMMAVGLSKKEAGHYLEQLGGENDKPLVSIGCVNSPKSVTLTGQSQQLEKLQSRLKEDRVFTRKLSVPVAYHSKYMEEIADEYLEVLGDLERDQTSFHCPMISTVTQDIVIPEHLSKAIYWVQNLTSTVEFDGAFSKLLRPTTKTSPKQLGRNVHRVSATHVLEIGPHSALRAPIQDIINNNPRTQKPVYITCLSRDHDASAVFLKAIGILHCAGAPVNTLLANGLVSNYWRPTPENMPKYPFNHERLYWNESRLSTNFRFRTNPRHDLLGSRSLDWNPQMAQWRNMLRLEEVPWLSDHKINGTVVIPAAAMLVMALEAYKSLFKDQVRTIERKHVNFFHAIRFPVGVDKIETQFNLSTGSDYPATTSWSTFRLFVVEDHEYVECCHGSIRGAPAPINDGEDLPTPNFLRGQPIQTWINHISGACEFHVPDSYDMPPGSSVSYGPSFQILENTWVGSNGEAMAELKVGSWELSHSKTSDPEYAVHPTTLDGFAQLILPALARQRSDLPTLVPVRLGHLYVDIGKEGLRKERIQVMAESRFRGYRGTSAHVIGFSPESNRPLMWLEDIDATFIASSHDIQSNQEYHRPLCMRMTWEPDIDLLRDEDLLWHCTRGRPKQSEETILSHTNSLAITMCFIRQALEYLQNTNRKSLVQHLELYVSWMGYQEQRLLDGKLPISMQNVQHMLDDNEYRELMISQIEPCDDEGQFYTTICHNLIPVLCGDVDPLDLVFRDGLAERYYETMLGNEHHSYPVSSFLRLLSFKNPSMNIIEIGAGTGGQTMRVLDTLCSDGIKQWQKYDYTDISPAFFEKARAKFKKYSDQMTFCVCDISQDPVPQSFKPGTYDLVIASHVLHATDELDTSLCHIRKLLKPGGMLLLFETTDPDATLLGFAFGMLKDWWKPLSHEARSKYSPCLSVEQWDEHLKRTGFSGVCVEIPGQEDLRTRFSSIIISKAIDNQLFLSDQTVRRLVLIINESSIIQHTAATALRSQLAAEFACEILTLGHFSQYTSSTPETVVFLLELDAIFLYDICQNDYEQLKGSIIRSKHILWISRAVSDTDKPRQRLVDGLGRVLMSEDATRVFTTLSLDGDSTDCDEIVRPISQLLVHIKDVRTDEIETNYVVNHGTIEINRIVEDRSMSRQISLDLLPTQTLSRPLSDLTPISLQLGSANNLESLCWVDCDENYPSTVLLRDDEILVQVKAIGLTSRDHLVVSGQLNEVELGTDCAGTIVSAGKNSGFQIGDRICLLGIATIRSHLRAKQKAAIVIPENMSFVEAASMPSAIWLAYHGLVNVASLHPGETVLIARAANSAGQMAIQLARQMGANIITIARSKVEVDFLRREFQLSNSEIVHIDESISMGKVLACIAQREVDVVFGPLSDEGQMELQDCLGPLGRLIDTSIKSPAIESKTQIPLHPNVTKASINLMDLLRKRPELTLKIFRQGAKTAFEHKMKPPKISNVFGFDAPQAAFKDPQLRGDAGGTVIEFTHGTPVKVKSKTKEKYKFRADATYVIAGGLGGLGRSFARWMASRGARHLILLSRSGPQKPVARVLVRELESQGVQVMAPMIDIGDAVSLRHELKRAAQAMPPIRGCIQGTVALRDNIFENMTYQDWEVSTHSKVAGSWNLHECLPQDLDFFVLLSSLNGIFGGRAQANYAAGNCFKDALAHYRVSQGQKAVVIDLGLMTEEGVVAEDESLLTSMRRIGHLMEIRQEELISLLSYYCDPELHLLDDSEQILIGIEKPSVIASKGIDLHHSILRPMFRQLFRTREAQYTRSNESSEEISQANRAKALAEAISESDATGLVKEWLCNKLGQILGVAATDIDVTRPLHTYGLDSLVAVDLRNWFSREIRSDIKVFMLLGNTSIEQLVSEATKGSRHRG